MKKILVLFCAFICQLFFVNASFAQSQDTFYGVKFGASKQEITNTFEKQGFIVPGTGYDDFLLFFPPAHYEKVELL